MNQGVRNPFIHAPRSAASREEMALFMNGGDVVEAFPMSRFRIQIAGVLSKCIDCVIFELFNFRFARSLQTIEII